MKKKSLQSKRIRIGSALLVVAAMGLAACGGSSSSDTTDGGSDTTEPAAESGNLADALGYTDNLLPDVKCSIASVLAMTGPGAFYGKTMGRAIDMAIEDISAAGGPTFDNTVWDHKSGDPAAGATAITEIVAKGITIKLASYVDDLGAMFAGTTKGKVFTLDGGGGTSVFGKGIPFFWGTRAITPNDTLTGVFEWFKQTYPDKKTVGLLGWELGSLNQIIKDDVLKEIKAAGLEFNGLYELNAVGAVDFSQSITKIKANQPDLLVVSVYGQDPGLFANQASTAGLTSVLVGSEFTPDGVKASKGTWENGWTFAYDYFDINTATSPIATYFLSQFRAKYGEDPDFYAANFYENTIRLWELMREAADSGVTADKLCLGVTLEAALQADLTMVSLYGGDSTTNGASTQDAVTHSVKERPMGVFTYKDGKVTNLASFGIGGAGFEMAG